MNNIKQIVDAIGRDELATALNCVPTAIINASSRGSFPAAWYPIVKELGKSKHVKISDDLFNFRLPEQRGQ